MRFKPLNGFRDFFPADMAFRRWIESAWHAASRSAGFEEWDGPVLEPLELFTKKSGEEIVAQTYAFEDKGGRQVSLRPEMTPTLVRMIAARAGGLPKPIKWYCVPQFYRYERPQRGRGREFFQWNVDVVGSAEPAADAEVMALAVQALRQLGLGDDDLIVRLSDRRVLTRTLEALEVPRERHGEVLGCIDKLERDPAATARLDALLGPAAAREIHQACTRYPIERSDELQEVLAACEDFDIAGCVELDFHIVRGLAYYTGPVFEIFARGVKLRAVAGGGRYDELIEAMGGPSLEAVGFGMGDMVLAELLRERGVKPDVPHRIDAYVVAIGPEMLRPARRVLSLLRARGVCCDAPYRSVRVAKALRAADQMGARRAILVGGEEWALGKVVERNLATGEERKVDVAELD